jgi:hypothetical protein
VTIRYEAELRELHRTGVIDAATLSRAVALDRGAIFSVFEELRLGLYGAVALITTGIGILIKQNLDRIGPLAIIGGLAFVAALCYASAVRVRMRGESRSLGGDYVLLLGALILSADVAYAESQFHWLGVNWSWHLLILAVVHGAIAYVLNSRLVLSVALTSLVAWFGVEHNAIDVLSLNDKPGNFGWRALLCAAIVLIVRLLHARSGSIAKFAQVYEHFTANLALWGALAWCSTNGMALFGVLVVTVFAIVSILKGLRDRQEMFIVYGVGYAALGYCMAVGRRIDDALTASVAILLIALSAAALLWHLHGHLKETEE